MAEMNYKAAKPRVAVRHRGRVGQVGIYLGKQLRMFVYQNDWKVLPMAALIAGLVGMVIRRKLFDSMESTLMSCFAMVMVCIWNGCFNSIQVICRERDVIKRQHRSGMHISSYIFSHMLYQLLLCALQTGITIYVTNLVGVRYDLGKPLFTPWFMVDFGITMLLITYASDMMSLWISCLAKTTTTAMTIMPFVLIFQLVFSGGMIALPAWTAPLSNFTISNPGIKVLIAQSDYNSQKVKTIWSQMNKLRDKEIGGDLPMAQVLDLLSNEDNETVAGIRAREIEGVFTLGQLVDLLCDSEAFAQARDQLVTEKMTLGDALRFVDQAEALGAAREAKLGESGLTLGEVVKVLLADQRFQPVLDASFGGDMTLGEALEAFRQSELFLQNRETQLGGVVTVGQVVDAASAIPAVREKVIPFKTTLAKLFDLVGEEALKEKIEDMAGEAGYNANYEYSQEKVAGYWGSLLLFVLGFALLSTITLEFIDKDKR